MNYFNEKQVTNAGKLAASFDDLKKRLDEVDAKYSLTYREPKLDLPESLNLDKLTYVMPTQEELEKTAQEKAAANYENKKHSVYAAEDKAKDVLENKAASEELNAEQRKQSLKEEFDEAVKRVVESAVNRNVARSSIKEESVKDAETNFENSAEAAENSKRSALDLIKNELDSLSERTKAALNSLDNSKDAELKASLTKLMEEAEKQRDAVTKYNNTVEEKEQKYQYGREQALELAKKREEDRALKAAEIYSKLGESGAERQKFQEKFAAVKEFFNGMSGNEALALLNGDSTLRRHFGKYFDYVEDYAKTL